MERLKVSAKSSPTRLREHWLVYLGAAEIQAIGSWGY